MRRRHPKPLLAAFLFTLLAVPHAASADLLLQAVGAVQGNIAGSATAAGHVNWITLNSFQNGVSVPIGANGLPAGPAMVSEVGLTKGFDPASIKLMSAAKNLEGFSTFIMEFADGPAFVPYYRVTLTGAHVDGYTQSSGGEKPSESLSLAFTTITFTDIAQGLSVTYAWNPTGATAAVTPNAAMKGILLPPSPNPSPGPTEFRFSLPSGSDAELTLFDAQGRRVRELHSGWTAAQSVVKIWDGKDDRGTKVAPGMYLARLAYPGTVVTQRFSVVR